MVCLVRSTSNRLILAGLDVLCFHILTMASGIYSSGIALAPAVDIDGIREPVSGSFILGNNIITAAVISLI